MGVLSLIDQANRKLKLKEATSIGLVAVVTTLLVPGLMAQQNWDDHDRSGKFATRDFAADYTNSCDKNAILLPTVITTPSPSGTVRKWRM